MFGCIYLIIFGVLLLAGKATSLPAAPKSDIVIACGALGIIDGIAYGIDAVFTGITYCKNK